MYISEGLAAAAVGAVSLIHFCIAAAEIFLARKLLESEFHFTPGEAGKTRPIVANAGLYNGFLAVGLLWSTNFLGDLKSIPTFFLSCVMVAGIFGAVTLKKPLAFWMQTIPAGIAAGLVWMSRP